MLLRKEFPIHELEKKWNASAELILEAISRAPDLTQRGVRGVIAEASFDQLVVEPLRKAGWRDETPAGDHPFDFALIYKGGSIRVQVKMQRLEKQVPKLWKGTGNARTNQPVYVAETQKTRTGKDKHGEDTRPYRFGEFDILAVCMHPSTSDWGRFMFTVATWLRPRPQNKRLIAVFQPVPAKPNNDWSSDFLTAVDWLRSGRKKIIAAP